MTSVRRGCVTVASVLPLTPAAVLWWTLCVSSAREVCGIMVRRRRGRSRGREEREGKKVRRKRRRRNGEG